MINGAYPQNQNGWNTQGGVQSPAQNAEQGLNIDIATMIQGGLNTVNSCMVPNGRTAALFDKDEPYFYLKSVNMNGQVVMVKRYKYEEDEPPSEFIPRDEFNKKFDELRGLILSLNAQSAQQAPQASQTVERKEGDH